MRHTSETLVIGTVWPRFASCRRHRWIAGGRYTIPSRCSSIDDATFKAVQARFGNDQLLQLTGAIGYYVMLAMTVNACELEAASGAEVLKP